MTKDLLTIRRYKFSGGIDILVKIDRVKKTISLVDLPDAIGAPYPDKRWYFSGRTIDYAKNWLVIFDCMRQATEMAIKDLEAIDKEEEEHFIDMMVRLEDAATERKLDEIDRAI